LFGFIEMKGFDVSIGPRDLRLPVKWMVFVAIASMAIAGSYFVYAWGKPQWPGGSSPLGLAYGVAAAAIMLFEFLLWPRKKVRSWRVGSGKFWLRAHIWLGILTIPLVLFHSGFLWGGQLSAVLSVLFIIVIASGFFGLLMQWILPRLMLETLPAETIYSQIDYVAEHNYRSAAELVAAVCGKPIDTWLKVDSQESKSDRPFVVVGAMRSEGNVRGKVLKTQMPAASLDHVEALSDSFERTIAPYLRHGKTANRQLHVPAQCQALFRDLNRKLPPAAHAVVDALEGLCDQRRQFDQQRVMHSWLHGWLCLHVPLSLAVVILMIIHAFVALKYWW